MAEYRDRYDAIHAAGADVTAIAVDSPEVSEKVRRELGLPFPILCDTLRDVLKAWDLLNAAEKGGIARPAVFMIARDQGVQFTSIDREAVRVSTSAVVDFLRSGTTRPAPENPPRKLVFPSPADWFRALRNTFRFGFRSRSR